MNLLSKKDPEKKYEDIFIARLALHEERMKEKIEHDLDELPFQTFSKHWIGSDRSQETSITSSLRLDIA